jgi:hypothetical protein
MVRQSLSIAQGEARLLSCTLFGCALGVLRIFPTHPLIAGDYEARQLQVKEATGAARVAAVATVASVAKPAAPEAADVTAAPPILSVEDILKTMPAGWKKGAPTAAAAGAAGAPAAEAAEGALPQPPQVSCAAGSGRARRKRFLGVSMATNLQSFPRQLCCAILMSLAIIRVAILRSARFASGLYCPAWL